jgi:carboxypeptidase PM20D1
MRIFANMPFMKAFFRLVSRLILIGAFSLVAILIAKTITFSSRQVQQAASVQPSLPLGAPFASLPDGSDRQLDSLLPAHFPMAYTQLQAEGLGSDNLLLKWPGKQAKLGPILLVGSALNARAILEAIEWLIGEEYYPERTIYLAIGRQGLEKLDIRPEFVLDEGASATLNALEGLDAPLAAIGVAEMGSASFSLLLDSAAAKKALERIQQHPFPASYGGLAGQFFDYVGPEMGGLDRMILANRWLFGSLVQLRFSSAPLVNNLIRSVAAPGGDALVHVRILPGETIASTKAFLEKIIENPNVIITLVDGANASEPSPVSPTDSFGFQVLQKTVGEIFPGAVTAPYVTTGNSDSRYYRSLKAPVYHFSPLPPEAEGKISAENYERMIRFYRQLIRNSCL